MSTPAVATARRASGRGEVPAPGLVCFPAEDGPLVIWARWIRAGILPRLSRSARDVASVLASYASKEGTAYPSAATIANLTAHTRTTVFQALAELVSAGVVVRDGHVKRRALNARGPVIYRFQAPPASMCLSEQDGTEPETHRLLARLRRGDGKGTATSSRCLSEADGGSPARRTGVVLPEGRLLCVPGAETQKGLSAHLSERREGAGGGVGEPEGPLPSASPQAAFMETAERRLAAIRTLLDTCSRDQRLCKTIALKAGYSESEIAEALNEQPEATIEVDRERRCEATIQSGLGCAGHPLVGSRFCERHQMRRETACVSVA